MTTKKILKKIFNEGYCVHENVLSKKECFNYIEGIKNIKNKIEKNINFKSEKLNQGQEIIRDIVLRDPDIFLNIIDNALVIKVLHEIFKETFILDTCVASNSVNVKNNYSALVHIDSHLASNINNNTSDVVVLFCLDDFTKKNGATKIWPGSHLSGVRIQNSKNYKKLIKKKNVYVEGKKGSIFFFLGQTWHQIGKNVTNNSRWSILCHYKRWWIKPSTDYTKCGAKIYSKLNQNQKKLFGFNSISPKFNFKTQTRMLKTLRKSSVLNLSYKKVINF
jgi:ectoine hydroxylase-related dioxygenase (phytanoyl-CoA dioxygenase family)